MITTDAKIIYAHYLAGRYPSEVPVGLPDDLRKIPAERIAECCTARALGASDRVYFQAPREANLPAAHEVAERVASLLYPKAATEAKQ